MSAPVSPLSALISGQIIHSTHRYSGAHTHTLVPWSSWEAEIASLSWKSISFLTPISPPILSIPGLSPFISLFASYYVSSSTQKNLPHLKLFIRSQTHTDKMKTSHPVARPLSHPLSFSPVILSIPIQHRRSVESVCVYLCPSSCLAVVRPPPLNLAGPKIQRGDSVNVIICDICLIL